MSEEPILRRRQPPATGGDSDGLPTRPEGFDWPVLWAFLTQRRWEDGSERHTGTVLVFSEQGRLKACLNDRDAEAAGFITLTGRGDPLDELEDALRSDAIDWRASNARTRRKG